MSRTSSSSSGPRLVRRAAGVATLAAALVIGATSSALAAPTHMVDLGNASTYAVLSGASVGNTASAPGAPHTTLRGDLGVNAAAQPTGFGPGVVTGATHVGDTAAAAAHADLVTAYAEVAARIGGTTLGGALAGVTVGPGLHTVTGAVSNTTTVTLDGRGDPNAVFVFQVDGALAMAAGSHVKLINKARASRVFWQVNGAGSVGANADFAGTLMALNAVGIGAGTLVNGRAFARNGALTLDANEFYSSPPAVTITDGATATTTDTTPTISGTTDLETGPVTVTIDDQTLTATPTDGAWSVTAAILANATYPVVASVTDAAGNSGSATQQLTLDTVLPQVSIDDGPSVTTNDPTPTVAGTSDVATGTTVRVTIGSQQRTALVQAGGVWNVTATTLTDGARAVTASVKDPAGNEGTDSQVLTVDTTAPAVTIAGGATALTKDATPMISGTAAVPLGTLVTVNLADETLTGHVQSGGAWSVTAANLSDGPHRIVMSASDTAGNEGRFTQTLTIDTVAPLVSINGGAAATTSDVDPTLTGTSSATPGTIVTVSIGGQTLTTLVQANGTWNVTPTVVGAGTWQVLASAPDPAGNVGRDGQTLTIGPAGTPPPDTSPTPSTPPATVIPPVVAPWTAPPASSTRLTPAAAESAVAPSGSRKLKPASLWIGTKVTAPPAGRVIATASGAVKIKGVKQAIKLNRVTKTVAAGRSATLKLKPKGAKRVSAAAFARIKRAVRQGKRVTATIRVKLVDARGTARTVKRTMTLT